MYKGIFFINHALRVPSLSVYSEKERFEQTLETIDSIDKHCPNNIKYIFDSSYMPPDMNYVEQIEARGANFIFFGEIPEVRTFSAIGGYGTRSIAECISFMHLLDWFKDQGVVGERVYKLSGRYRVNDNFILDDDRFKDAFVFSEAIDTWMPEERQRQTGISKLYRLRFWHMDYSLLNDFRQTLPKIFHDCSELQVDVEHAYYKNLSTYKTIELDKIGVCGNIAPSGDYIDE